MRPKAWWLVGLAPLAILGLFATGVVFMLTGGFDAGGAGALPPGAWGVPAGPGARLCAAAAHNAGILDRENLVVAVAVGLAESGCDPHRLNDNPLTGDYSMGLWQINMIGGLGPERERDYQLPSYDALYDPAINARVMFTMSARGTVWEPAWSTHTNGAYLTHLAEARTAVDELDAGSPLSLNPTGNLVALPFDLCDGLDALHCQADASWAPRIVALLRAAPMGLRIISAYRTTAEQAAIHASGVYSAKAGESNHEKGLAVDLEWAHGPAVSYRDAAWLWLAANGAAYGVLNALGTDDPVHWSYDGH